MSFSPVSCLFDAQIVSVALLFDLVLHYKLLAHCSCNASGEGIGRVCSWVGWYHVCPCRIAHDEPILALRDHTCQMAVLLSLIAVMGLHHGEDSTELILEFVNGLRCDYAIEACEFVLEGDKCVVRIM